MGESPYSQVLIPEKGLFKAVEGFFLKSVSSVLGLIWGCKIIIVAQINRVVYISENLRYVWRISALGIFFDS